MSPDGRLLVMVPADQDRDLFQLLVGQVKFSADAFVQAAMSTGTIVLKVKSRPQAHMAHAIITLIGTHCPKVE
jgi:hypothetical protein